MRTKFGVLLALGIVGMVDLLGGCSGPAGTTLAPATAPTAPAADSRPEHAAPAPASGLPRLASSPAVSPGPPDALIARAVAEAANRVGVPAVAVKVVQVEAREWPDRSLGCPQPGIGYAQSITPGYLIVVEAQAQRLRYHTDHAEVVYCDAPL